MPRSGAPGARWLGVPLALLVGTMSLGAAAFAGGAAGFEGRRGYEGPGPGMRQDLGVDLSWPLVPVLLVLVAALALGHPYGPVLLAPALSLHAPASRYPLRTWLPWSAALVPMLLAAGVQQPYLGFLNPQTYGAVVFGVVVCLFPAMFAILRGGPGVRRSVETVTWSWSGRRPRSGSGSPVRCTTSSATASQ